MRKTLFLTLMLLANSAFATSLFTETSQPGESMDDFVVRVAPQAVAYTMKHNVEVCGMIAKDGDKLVLEVGTQGVNNGCSISVPANSTGMTFHTHPSPIAFKFHDKDFAVPGYLGTVRGVRFQQGVGTERFVGRFSERVSRNLISSR